ncbi:hypothetical protein VTI74DRAFT_5274 [Chaetomium olivicolor]
MTYSPRKSSLTSASDGAASTQPVKGAGERTKMGSNGGSVNPNDVDIVADITDILDRGIITAALQANNGNVETVIGEFFDDPDKFRKKYGWDESAFSSGREGEDTTGSNNNPSFVIHPPVIYGTEPNSFYAPSRPPSRANNRSPMSRLVDFTTPGYSTDTPSSRQEEDDHLQRAINESLNVSGGQSSQTLPPPPPLPLPQQSGVTTANGETYFGPANRPDYDPNEWAMVQVAKEEKDPEPSLRARQPWMPVFLRFRGEITWTAHRLGPLLMIYHQIPAARNALLKTGEAPLTGYGNCSDWWKGHVLLRGGQPAPTEATSVATDWAEELHRLVAFLEGTDRTYGTADPLASALPSDGWESGDAEKDFIQRFTDAHLAEGTGSESLRGLVASVEIVSFDELEHDSRDCFGLLDLQIVNDPNGQARTLYDVLNWVFFADIRLAKEDPSSARMAWIDEPSQVFTCRFQGEEGFAKPIEIPETLYLDRYMKANASKIKELQTDMVALLKLLDANMAKEESLIRYVSPKTHRSFDRRALCNAGIRRAWDRVTQIKNRAFWRNHENACADGTEHYYLPDHTGEPDLLPEEARVVALYEAKIRELAGELAEIERVMNERVLRQRECINRVNSAMAQVLTVPTEDGKWNPTHKYTLRGVVNNTENVYLRMLGPSTEQELTSSEEAGPSSEEGWWRIRFNEETNTVACSQVTFETVMTEACGVGSKPLLVYATDQAMKTERSPLSDSLKTFIKLDNRHFKQELAQAERLSPPPDKKRSAVLVLGDDAILQSKRLQRSNSIDSMATNQASAGDLDDDMRDAPFDNDEAFNTTGRVGMERNPSYDDDLPDLIDLSDGQPGGGETKLSPASPVYERDIEMGMGMGSSPPLDRLAQVSLQDAKSSHSSTSLPKAPEMQERGNAPFFTAAMNAKSVGGDGGNGEDCEQPMLIELEDRETGSGQGRVSGM